MTALARLSLANRTLVMIITLVISGFGIYAIPSLKQQLLPEISLPVISVVAPYPGAGPEIVEEQVTGPIESSLQGLDGITEVVSTSSDGLARIQVTFDYGSEVEDLAADVESAVNDVEAELPDTVEPMVIAGSTDDIPVMALAVSDGSDGTAALLDKLERRVVPELESIEHVRDVAITGARDEQVVITPDPAKFAAAGVNPGMLPVALQANGVAIPAGSLTTDDRTMSVAVGDQITSVEELADIYLTGSKGPVRLGDVATVELRPEPITSITRTNGEPSLGLAVTMTKDGNAVEISHQIRDMLPELEDVIGSDAEITVIFDQAPWVERSIEDLTTEGLLGLGFAVLVIMIFLLSLRSTLVTAVSIPLSVVVALVALWIGDYSLNLLTLGGLTISVGRVVDDSIVVLENIKRHLGYGVSKREAVLTGVREVAGAVTASTLTTVAVFLPIALVGGLVSEMFSSFGITVTVALLASLLVSLTVIPVLAYWFLKPPRGEADREEIRRRAEEKELRSPLQRMYIPVLRFATRFKVLTIAIGLAVMVGTFALVPNLKTSFIDSSGQETTQISLSMPIGTALDATDEAASKIEDLLQDAKQVESYQVNVGSGNPLLGGLGSGGNKATFTVTLAEGTDTPAFEAKLREQIADLALGGDVVVGQESGMHAFGNAVEVIVRAPDTETLAEAAGKVEDAMADIAGLRDVTSSVEEAAPRIDVTVDRQKAAAVGLTEAQIGQTVAQAFRGAPLGEVLVDGRTADIVLRSGTAPASMDEIKALMIPTPAGTPVRLSDVASVAEVPGPVQVTRIDGERSATISAAANIDDLGAVTSELTEALADLDLPDGATYTIAGASADQEEAFGDLGLAMLIAIALVFVIMVATFRSLVQPLILLVSIPFAATGAIGLLLITDTPLGVPAMIGLLMLIGIVVTNAIVLIDLINQYRARGMEIRQAVIEGGRRRLRPILMTAIATVCALIPMSLGFTGSGGFISQSLAIVVIGGLVSSTPLTLLLVPALYTLVERAKQRFSRKRSTPPTETPTSVDTTKVTEPAPVG